MPSLMLRHFYLCHNLIQWLLNGGTAAPLGNGRDTWQCLGMCLVVMSRERQESRLTPKIHGPELRRVCSSPNSSNPRNGSSRRLILPWYRRGAGATGRSRGFSEATESTPWNAESVLSTIILRRLLCSLDAQDPGLLLQQMPFPFMALEAPLSGCAQRPGNCHRGLIHFAIPG